MKQLFAVTGKPILHSKSPLIFNSEFSSSGYDGVYFRLCAESAEEAIQLSHQLNLKGLNITAPFKETVIQYLTSIDSNAQAVGSVNTVVFENGQSIGTNTDIIAVVNALKSKNIQIEGKQALVIGAGGAAKACIYGLKSEGCQVTLLNRTYEKALKISSQFNCRARKLEQLQKEISNAEIIISAVSSHNRMINPEWLNKKHFVFDANYKASPLTKDASKIGCTIVTGLDWLYHHALAAFEFMTGKEPDKQAIRQALFDSEDNMKSNLPLALTGFMASGKTSIGRDLQNYSGYPLYDTDDEITEVTGHTIPEIFQSKGENHFRELESSCLINNSSKKRSIISTGGGCILSHKNRTVLKKNTLSIWLYSSPKATLKRIDKTSRPLLNTDNPEHTVKNMLSERLEYYAECCDILINTEKADSENIRPFTDKILYEIRETFGNTHFLMNSPSSQHSVLKIGNGHFNGNINAPTSKSQFQRAVAASVLASGSSTLEYHSLCDDSRAALGIARALGAEVALDDTSVRLTPSEQPQSAILNCGESGLSIRMFSPVAAVFDSHYFMKAEGSLTKRPVSMIEDTLRESGVIIATNNNFPPVSIQGPLSGGTFHVDGSLSSQFLTGLLIALPKAQKDSIIHVTSLKSKPYIDMTIELLGQFGVHITHENYTVFRIKGCQEYTPISLVLEGDWSGASFFLTGAALTGSLTLNNLNTESSQGDMALLDALKASGAEVNIGKHSVTVKRGALKHFNFDATECPDLFPPLAVLAACCHGVSRIKGTERLKHKESDRGKYLTEDLMKVGVDIYIENNTMIINGGNGYSGLMDTHHDHRLAMAYSILGLVENNTISIKNPSCVSKSYDNFFTDFVKAGGQLL